MVKAKNILVLVAHSDDETIGMGGTIKKHVSRGDIVNIVSMTDGVSARSKVNSDAVYARRAAALKASQILGFNWLAQHNFEDNALDKYPLIQIIKKIEVAKDEFKPDLVYTHTSADLNVDHRILAIAVLTAFRPEPYEACNEIRLFEVASATDFGHANITGKFLPNLFVEITEEWDTKEAALNAYVNEMKAYPHCRSIEGLRNLAKLRGNQVGLTMAEAFQVIRKIEQ